MFAHYWPLLVPLSFLVPYLLPGTRPHGGFRRLYASIITKARGTRTPETGTTAGCSFFYRLGPQSAVGFGPIWHPPANSYTAHGASISVTAIPGASGERPDDAG